MLFDLDPETPVPLEDGKENGGDKIQSTWIIIMIYSLIVTEMLNFLWIDNECLMQTATGLFWQIN